MPYHKSNWKTTRVTLGKSSSTKGGLVVYKNNNFNFNINKLSIRNHNWEAQVIALSGGGLSLDKYEYSMQCLQTTKRSKCAL